MKSLNLIRRKADSNSGRTAQAGFGVPPVAGYLFYENFHFQHLLRIERRRSERSRRPFLLLLLDISGLNIDRFHKDFLEKIKFALASSSRETDIRGWYDPDKVIGIICTEMTVIDEQSIKSIHRNIHTRLSEKIDAKLLEMIIISFHIFPETKGETANNVKFNKKLYPELTHPNLSYRLSATMKKMIDLVGSSVALLILAPLLLLIAVTIKLTSAGPIFFKQQRLGLNGKAFMVLKFRSMYTDCDITTHKEYIKKYITDQCNAAVEPGVFKLNNDPRITPIGRILRKTSFDELPQLLNVLKGDMSLVGPRPPISYEIDLYNTWHMRRLFACKPGITGLWQVSGRSRTTFDEMVRLDLKYIAEWSLWLDLKILLKTPMAVLNGHGAY